MVSDRCRCKNCICEENIFVIFVNSNLIDFNVQGLLPVSFPISNLCIAKDTRLITLLKYNGKENKNIKSKSISSRGRHSTI